MTGRNDNKFDREHELWISVRDQGKAIIALEANQESISKSLGQITETLKSLTVEVSQSHRTQWPVIFGTMTAATGVLLMVGGIVAYAWMSDITDVGKRVDALAEHFQTHESKAGHPEAVIGKVAELKDSFKDADNRLNERLNRQQDQINYLSRRTGVLFNKGEPY